jgi:hypothetical protein
LRALSTSYEPHEAQNSAETDAPTSTDAHEAGACPGAVPSSDPVEAALADALQRAALAGAWDAVAALTAELRGRREARAGVIDLASERERRR